MRTRDLAELALVEALSRPNPVVCQPHIEINQQPNDAADSARLYGELKAKAEADVLASVKVGDNIFECVVQRYRDEMSDSTKWRAIFTLNGKQMTATVEIRDRQQFNDNQVRDCFAQLRGEMAKVIAGQVLNDAFLATLRKRIE